jgi:hypothetical protein
MGIINGIGTEGSEFFQIGDRYKVEHLIRPSDADVVAIYTVHNQWQLKDTIDELAEGQGLYSSANDAYVMISRFLYDFDDNQSSEGYTVPMSRVQE